VDLAQPPIPHGTVLTQHSKHLFSFLGGEVGEFHFLLSKCALHIRPIR
jgi:hypothetical protein